MKGDLSMTFVSLPELNSALNKLAEASGKTVREVLPAQMRLFAADLAFNTRPIGKTSAGQKVAHKKVEDRIMTVYPNVGMMAEMLGQKEERLKKAFIAMVKRRELVKAAKLLNDIFPSQYTVGEFDGGKLHQDQQFTKRVNKRLVVINYPKVKEYIREKKALVGFAKGGYAAGARQLGGVRGIPGYATRQKSPGTGSVRGTGRTLTVTLTNGVRYAAEALDKHGEARAIAHRERAVAAVCKRILDRKAKSASRSLR
jgi:hypothetical protein